MAITIYLPHFKIKDQEDTTIINTFNQIFTDKGAKFQTININDIVKYGNINKLVVIELENFCDEKQIIKEIYGMKIFNGLELRPEISHSYEIMITSIPSLFQDQEIQEEITKLCKDIQSDYNINIKNDIKILNYEDSGLKVVYFKLGSKELAETLIEHLNIQKWGGQNIKAQFTQNKQTEKTIPQSNSAETNSTNVEEFYKNSDYDLVNKNLRTFIYEICKSLNS